MSDPSLRPARLYVRAGCHLCEQFLLELALEVGAAVDQVVVVDVDRDPALAVSFGLRVPVFEVDGAVACEGAYDRSRVRQALRL